MSYEPSGSDGVSSTAQPTTPGTTDRVKSITSGRVHGTRDEAFEVVSGSTFDIPIDDPLVRFESGPAADETAFSVGVDPNRVDACSHDGNDVIVRGTYEDFFTTGKTAPTDTTSRVLVQTSSRSCTAFSEFNAETGTRGIPTYAAKYVQLWVDGWVIMEDWIDRVLAETLDNDHNVVMRLSVLRTLFDPHPTHSLDENGKYVITDEALIDPDYYESSSDAPDGHCNPGHGKGGNYHDEYHFLKHGQCPAEDCTATFDTFRSLRSHIGGKATPNETPEENAHDRTNLRLQDLDIEASTSVEAIDPVDVIPESGE